MNQSDLYTSFGFFNVQPVLIGLILFFQLIYIPYAEVQSFATPIFSHVTGYYVSSLGVFIPNNPACEEV